MKRIALLALSVAALLTVPIVAAQGGGGYDLTWFTIDGGGGASSGGGYTLMGTIGQPDAGIGDERIGERSYVDGELNSLELSVRVPAH
jgi:hypothetical protein